jgi:thiol:disulfide interchange protein DsbD
MLRFKQFLAFPMFATAAWLLWVLTNSNGSMALVQALTATVLVAWLLWWAHGTPSARRAKLTRFAAACVVVWGVFTQTSTVPASGTEGGITTVPYDAQVLQKLRAEGTPVFIDATADWCITCKINERIALRDSATQALFAERGITLMIADWTRQDAAITEYLKGFGRNGVPLYVYYAPNAEPVVLPQLLTPSAVQQAITATEPSSQPTE